jgi:hypothetical protein
MEQPFDLNPLTQIWRIIDASHVFTHFFIKYLKYLKLAKMAIVHILRSVKDEMFFISCIF